MIPNGRRSSDPVPVPRASGNPPSNAAIVVIRMGRNRRRHASIDSLLRDEVPRRRSVFDREINHQNGVFLHDPNQQNNADDRDDAKLRLEQQQREYRADARRRQRGKNRDRMDIALVQHAKHNIDGNKRRQNEDGFAFQGKIEMPARFLESFHAHLQEDQSRVPRGPSASTASPNATPGPRLNESVIDGNWP